MLHGVQGKTAGTIGSIVPQFPGNESVSELMERDAHQGGNNRKENTQKIRKVKPFPDILYNAYCFSLPGYIRAILTNSGTKNKSRAHKLVPLLCRI